MSDGPRTEQLLAEVQEIRQQLAEATAALDAIRNGDADALVVAGVGGEKVYTLEGAERPYRVLIEAMQQGAATLSADGTILFCNLCLAVMFQTPQEKVTGTPLQHFVPPADHPHLEAMLREAQASHAVGEIRFHTGMDTLLPVQLALSALPLPGTTALGLIVTDLTEQKRQQELMAAHRRKDDFLAILAHELRNPLAPIRSAVQLLNMPSATDDMAARARETIERQVGNLTRLVDELLDVSRISRGKIQLRKESLELATVVQRAAEAAYPLVKARQHVLSIELPSEPIWLEADPTRLEQILVNLLNNAAKYTEPGGRIWISAKQAGNEAVLTVKDTGVGIAPDLLPQIFELFTQADHSLDHSQGGLGIGLTLVRSLVGLHGGSITAHSDGLGKGSEFVVRLPLLPQARTVRPNGIEGVANCNEHSFRVLVVDDNQDAGEMLGTLLRLFGHEVKVVHSGWEAIHIMDVFLADVVLLDIGLPGMDGYQAAQRLRQQPGGENVLIVAVTGYGQEEYRQRATTAGFDHHLVKPVDTQVLQNLLLRWGNRRLRET
jgi:signal transduction histidine kinase/CheY-like chemotaxis protein